ncbi:FAD-dependent 5-carboxymethylaminomethyl-2-thiouridine(34) oxidoreductase MnmC [Pelagibaculum spongiae]|uniref:tRNA 5-methylaminomethyl-2-thiouridine biosynthesis bifunctional protein MnmC n=1 Tax=Pelagibaculum spongiae TaxID=2080658 RepID=A0A2V1GYL4_9GAMM|nr:FAD-dependent 5-carboxymethylaminomethyl-2-thiouridine(34) oxidoreductase MnmC [Pelagibaculum spongiae]PVZ69735.1 hypothetical protein DC094_10570 [Pelagibaculum spongiae]
MQHGDLHWKNSQGPSSSQFGEVYYHSKNGLKDHRAMFLQGNQLPKRWHGQNFVIGETGFGAGLNFLSSWLEWKRNRQNSERLHYISAEQFPLSRADLQAALAPWSELAPFTKQLLKQWPRAWAGFHRMHFEDGITLDLLLGDASEMWQNMNASVDAWYLDGFSPNKNPQIWQGELFQAIANCSHQQTTLASSHFTSSICHQLAEIGFAAKQGTAAGQFCKTTNSDIAEVAANSLTEQPVEQPIIVVGAGLAGCHLARRLAEHGQRVILLEQNSQVALGASGNPAGLLKPLLHLQPSKREIFHNIGYFYSLRRIEQLSQTSDQPIWNPCGIVEQPGKHSDNRLASMLQKRPALNLVAQLIPATANQTNAQASSLIIDQAGICAPAKICHLLIDHPSIELKTGVNVAHLEQHNQFWKLFDQQRLLVGQANNVIFCPGHLHQLPEQFDGLLTRPLQGQVSQIKSNKTISHPAICGKSYIAKIPGTSDQYCIGATFNRGELNTEVDSQQDQQNIAALQQLLPEEYDQLKPELISATSGIRATVPDYTPIAGALKPGLWINTGHGARGLVTAPLVAEILTSQLCNLPYPNDLSSFIDPSRKAARVKRD